MHLHASISCFLLQGLLTEAWSCYLSWCTAACQVTSCLRRVCRRGEVCYTLPHTPLHQRSTGAPGRTDRCVSWTCRSEETSKKHTERVTWWLNESWPSRSYLSDQTLNILLPDQRIGGKIRGGSRATSTDQQIHFTSVLNGMFLLFYKIIYKLKAMFQWF